MGNSRELRLMDRILKKFGFTQECPGCIHKQLALDGHRTYSILCRQRIYDLMKEDEDEMDHMLKVDERCKRIPPVAERIG